MTLRQPLLCMITACPKRYLMAKPAVLLLTSTSIARRSAGAGLPVPITVIAMLLCAACAAICACCTNSIRPDARAVDSRRQGPLRLACHAVRKRAER